MPTRTASVLFRVLSALVAVAVLSVAYIYGASEWKLRRQYDAPLTPLRAQAPPDVIAGMHMAKVVGCWAGCHGKEAEGGHHFFDGNYASVSPTLSQVLPLYSDDELARLIRYGVKRDGTTAVGMISQTFWPLSDQDLVNIIAHLRRQPVHPPVQRIREITFRGRFGLVTGAWRVSADLVDRSIPRWGELPRTTSFERGRYLASITCTECHGLDFRGNPLEGGPSLVVLAGYQLEQFRHLLHTGKPIGGRNIPKMSWMPDVDFSEQEISDIYRFLREYHGLTIDPE